MDFMLKLWPIVSHCLLRLQNIFVWGFCFCSLTPGSLLPPPPPSPPPSTSTPNSPHTTHLTQLIFHNSSYTTHLTISYNSSSTTHFLTTYLIQLIFHNSSHTSHLPQLISHLSSHTTYLTQLISYNSSQQLISYNSSSTTHLTPHIPQFISHLSSHTTHLTSLIFHSSSHTTYKSLRHQTTSHVGLSGPIICFSLPAFNLSYSIPFNLRAGVGGDVFFFLNIYKHTSYFTVFYALHEAGNVVKQRFFFFFFCIIVYNFRHFQL